MRLALRLSAWGIGIGGAALMIFAEEGRATNSVALLGASLVWAGSIFLPLIYFNRDLYRSPTARVLVGVLLVIQALTMAIGLRSLIQVPFIYWFPLCAIQLMLYELPFVWLRKNVDITSPK